MISNGIMHSAPNHFSHVRPCTICFDTHAQPQLADVHTQTHTPVNTVAHAFESNQIRFLTKKTLEGFESPSSQQYAAAVYVGLWATEGGYEWCYLKQDRGAGGTMRWERINRVTERRWEGRCLSGRMQSRGSERTILTVWEGSDGDSWSCCVRGKNNKKYVTVWEIESWGRISSTEYLTFQLSISSKNHYCQWLG